MCPSLVKATVLYLMMQCLMVKCDGSYVEVIDEPSLKFISPELDLLDPKNDVVDIKANSSIRLRCEGSRAIDWLVPDNVLVKKTN